MKTKILKSVFIGSLLVLSFLSNNVFSQPYQFVREIVAPITTPHGIVVDNSGNIYVVEPSNNRITKLNSIGTQILQWGMQGAGDGQFNQPSQLAIDAVGNIYVTDLGNQRIQKFNSQGIFLAKWGTAGTGPGQFQSPGGISVDVNGDVFVMDATSVQRFTNNGAFINRWPLNGQNPFAFTVDRFGNIFVGTSNNSIQKYGPAGNLILQWGTGGTGPGQFQLPWCVKTDYDGNVFVTDLQNSDRIQKFNPSGAYMTEWIGTGPPAPSANTPLMLTFDNSGLLYAANFNTGRIRIFSPLMSITTTTNTTSVCQGSSLVVNYTALGTFNSGNIFTAQLSDASGSFANPTAIGSITSTSSGVIIANLPSNIAPGSAYRVRVMASSPVFFGSDNGTNITINPKPITSIVSGPGAVCAGQSYVYTVVNHPGSMYNWNFPAGVINNTGNGMNSVNLTFANTGGLISVTETNMGCTSTPSTLNVTVRQSPNNNLSIAGSTVVCNQEQNVVYSVSNAVAGATYNWNVSGGATIATGMGTPQITVNWGTQSGTVSVYEVLPCGNGLPAVKNVAVQSSYSLGSLTAFCGAGFCVPFKTVGPIKNGLIGLDFVINYDATKLTPTGTATLGTVATSYGSYSLNIATAGKVYVSVFLNNAPSNTYFSGDGDILCVNFNVATGTSPGTVTPLTTDGIEESTYIGSNINCKALPGSITSSGVVGGKLIYRNTPNQTLNYDALNPTSLIPTNIQGTSDCQSFANETAVPNMNGIFSYNPMNGNSIKITRDIKGDVNVPALNCTNVQNLINSSDFNIAVNIANFKYTPNIYELLSADVNLDGKVTAGDASLISSRIINANYCEFPQRWNYAWNGTTYVPASGYSKSLDWLFLDDATLATPAFMTGFGRNNVPTVPSCLSKPAGTAACSTVVSSTYHAVLLGDINGSWNSNNGNQVRLSNGGEIIFDLVNVVSNGSQKLIPVYYNGVEEFSGLDFSVDHNTNISAVKVVINDNTITTQWNEIEGQRLMVTAATSESFSSNEPVAFLEFNSNKQITSSDFTNAQAYLNGEPATISYRKSTDISTADFVLVFPNPSNSQTFIHVNDASSNVKLSVCNMNGVELFENELVPSNSDYMLPSLENGVYYIKITGSNGVITKKLIKY